MLIALKVARHTSHVTLHTSHVTRPPPSAHREMRLTNALAGHAAAAVCAGVTAARAARQRHHRTPQVPRRPQREFPPAEGKRQRLRHSACRRRPAM
jgi:hypothetical protein